MSGTNYFSYFPQVEYSFPEGYTKTVTDIFKRVKMVALSNSLKASIFYNYTIKDGERPEDIANRYYGDTQYYWLILYTNNIISLYSQWPKSSQQFEDYITSTYGSFEDAQSIFHHYEDSNGNWTSYQEGVVEKSIFEYELDENEKKREIVIIRKEYLSHILNEMNKIFGE